MLGAIVGDVVGSVYELNNRLDKDFPLFSEKCFFTDDTVATLAVAKAILLCDGAYSDLSAQTERELVAFVRRYPDRGYGGYFLSWAFSDSRKPYRSFGNGAAMRVSPCAYAAKSLAQTKEFSRAVTCVTHDHAEGIKGAEAVAVGVYMALNGIPMSEIKSKITEEYYPIPFTLDSIRGKYSFDASCPGSVPQAFEAFFESEDFESAVRGAVSIGGDSDTIASIAGALAGAYYGVPSAVASTTEGFLDDELKEVLHEFKRRFSRHSV